MSSQGQVCNLNSKRQTCPEASHGLALPNATMRVAPGPETASASHGGFHNDRLP
jgi:hypothetical protein